MNNDNMWHDFNDGLGPVKVQCTEVSFRALSSDVHPHASVALGTDIGSDVEIRSTGVLCGASNSISVGAIIAGRVTNSTVHGRIHVTRNALVANVILKAPHGGELTVLGEINFSRNFGPTPVIEWPGKQHGIILPNAAIRRPEDIFIEEGVRDYPFIAFKTDKGGVNVSRGSGGRWETIQNFWDHSARCDRPDLGLAKSLKRAADQFGVDFNPPILGREQDTDSVDSSEPTNETTPTWEELIEGLENKAREFTVEYLETGYPSKLSAAEGALERAELIRSKLNAGLMPSRNEVK